MGETSRLEELKRRVEADPASIAFASLAEEYRRAARFDEAVEASRAGLRFHPTYVSARVTLGRSLMELALYDQAERELHVVARSTPDNLAARRALGDLYWRQGELVQALEQLRLASGLAPGDGELTEMVRELELGRGGVAAAGRGAGRRGRARRGRVPRWCRRRPRRSRRWSASTGRSCGGGRRDREPLQSSWRRRPCRATRNRPRPAEPARTRQLTGDPRRCHGAVVTHPLSGRHARVVEAIARPGRRRARRRQLVQHQVLDGVRGNGRHPGRDARSPLLAGGLPLQCRGRAAGQGRHRAAHAGDGVARGQHRLRSTAGRSGRGAGLGAGSASRTRTSASRRPGSGTSCSRRRKPARRWSASPMRSNGRGW